MLWAHGVGSAQCGAGGVCLTAEVEHDSDGRPWDWYTGFSGVPSAWCCVWSVLLAEITITIPFSLLASGLLFPYNPPFPPTPSCMRTLDRSCRGWKARRPTTYNVT